MPWRSRRPQVSPSRGLGSRARGGRRGGQVRQEKDAYDPPKGPKVDRKEREEAHGGEEGGYAAMFTPCFCVKNPKTPTKLRAGEEVLRVRGKTSMAMAREQRIEGEKGRKICPPWPASGP
jgi:hypothetical protein